MPRIEKVNELIRRELGKMILFGEINDPRVRLVTILSVDVSRDLQHARVRFSVLSDDAQDVQNAAEGLDRSRGYIRKLIGQRVVLRYTPEFQFIHDRSIQFAAQVDETLAEIKKKKSAEGSPYDE